MFCPKCGKDCPDNTSFCPNCGAALNAETQNAPVQKKSKLKQFGERMLGIVVAAVVVTVIREAGSTEPTDSGNVSETSNIFAIDTSVSINDNGDGNSVSVPKSKTYVAKVSEKINEYVTFFYYESDTSEYSAGVIYRMEIAYYDNNPDITEEQIDQYRADVEAYKQAGYEASFSNDGGTVMVKLVFENLNQASSNNQAIATDFDFPLTNGYFMASEVEKSLVDDGYTFEFGI